MYLLRYRQSDCNSVSNQNSGITARAIWTHLGVPVNVVIVCDHGSLNFLQILLRRKNSIRFIVLSFNCLTATLKFE